MPTWAVIMIIAISVLAVVGIGAAGWFAWRGFERRALMRIVVRSEAVEAATQALRDVFARLAEAEDDEVAAFTSDPDSSERRALYEVGLKADMITDELDRMRLPRGLITVAESVADASFLVAREARVVGENDSGEAALVHVAKVDLETVSAYTAQARRRVHETCVEHGLEETMVYGGGLYL